RRSLRRQLRREREVERALGGDRFRAHRDRWVAELQSSRDEPRPVLQIGEIELNLAVESGDARIDEAVVANTKFVERCELLRVEARYELRDLRLHVIHRA